MDVWKGAMGFQSLPSLCPMVRRLAPFTPIAIFSCFGLLLCWGRGVQLQVRISKTIWAVASAFNPNTREAEVGGSEFKVSLVYKVSSRTAWATQRNPVSKKQKKKIGKEKLKSFCNVKDTVNRT